MLLENKFDTFSRDKILIQFLCSIPILLNNGIFNSAIKIADSFVAFEDRSFPKRHHTEMLRSAAPFSLFQRIDEPSQSFRVIRE